jgi:hypothetical protein
MPVIAIIAIIMSGVVVLDYVRLAVDQWRERRVVLDEFDQRAMFAMNTIMALDVTGVHVEGRWTPRGHKVFIEVEGDERPSTT